MKPTWKLRVGIEIHARILVRTKLFSGASTNFAKGHGFPNSQVALFDAGIPGTLPVLNRECVHQAIRTGIALNGQINGRSVFERKHYFYGDSPLGFQITQQRAPIVSNGSIIVRTPATSLGRTLHNVRIERIQLEQDTGRTIYGGMSKTDLAPRGTELLDLNRAGVGLMEIVSAPDIEDPEVAGAFVATVRDILKQIGTCDGNMEDGSLRADVNISIYANASSSPRIEVKNLNSIKSVIKAVEYEYTRLLSAMESNTNEMKDETRSFDESTGRTSLIRQKESAFDYRFFPEPDLPVLVVTSEMINQLKSTLPELPESALLRLTSEPVSLLETDALVLLGDKHALKLFDESMLLAPPTISPQVIAKFICNEIVGCLSKSNLRLCDTEISADVVVELLHLIEENQISGTTSKKVLQILIQDNFMKQPLEIIKLRNWFQINNRDDLLILCSDTLDKLESSKKGRKMISDFKDGKKNVFEFFVGQAMQLSKGLANPRSLREVMEEIIKTRKG